MATLAPGILLKLLSAMNTGEKPTSEHRSALLQITDIVPADLDEKELWPKYGFYIKVSDSSHSIYVSLPYDQDDLVLSNKLQLGQFIYVEKLEPGSPVPIMKGTKMLPGRHPLVGTPEPIIARSRKSKFANRTRNSWVSEQNVSDSISSSPRPIKPIPLELEQGSPVIERSNSVRMSTIPISPLIRARTPKEGNSASICRTSIIGFSPKPTELQGGYPLFSRKNCVTPLSKLQRSVSVSDRDSKIKTNTLNFTEKSNTKSPLRTAEPRENRDEQGLLTSGSIQQKTQSRTFTENPLATIHQHCHSETPASKNKTRKLTSLTGKLGSLENDVIQQREAAQKIALQAIRDATATENLVRILKAFTELSSSAKPEDPATCFDQFLNFHRKIVQSVNDMEAIKEATKIHVSQEGSLMDHKEQARKTKIEEEEEESSILHEITLNVKDQNCSKDSNPSRRRLAMLSKSVSITQGKAEQKSLGKHPRSSTTKPNKRNDQNKASIGNNDNSNGENKDPNSIYSNAIRSAKEIETEVGNWFMEFLEKSLELGFKKTRNSNMDNTKEAGFCPQSLLLKVINWVETEQCDNSKRSAHPRATKIARKLRIKVKNP